MITHKTSYVFFNKKSDLPQLISDMVRSNGNRNKIVHKVDNLGDIIESYYYNDETNSLDITPTTPEASRKSFSQRKWVISKHKIINSEDSKLIKEKKIDILFKKYFR